MKRQVSSKVFAKSIARSASNLKAADIKIMDLKKLSSFTDFFVICSGTSTRHVQSIANRILMEQKKKGRPALSAEGFERSEWVLLDFGSVVAHIFYPEVRTFYNIERLWGDAPLVEVAGVTTAA